MTEGVEWVRETAVRFYLNESLVTLSEISPQQTVLDFLRLDRALHRHQGGLRRGRLRRLHRAGRPARPGRGPRLRAGQRLHPLPRVGRPLPRGDGRARSPAATARCIRCSRRMVDLHGSQCGFCTPGIRDVALRALDAQSRRSDGARSRRRCRAISAAAPATRRSSGPRRRFPATAAVEDDPLGRSARRWLGTARALFDDGDRIDVRQTGGALSCRPPSTISPRVSRRCRTQRWSRARPTSGSGSPSSCATSRRSSSSTASRRMQRGRGGRGRDRTIGAAVCYPRPRRSSTPSSRISSELLRPIRRRQVRAMGNDRRQHRQRLADRRHAAGADRARRDGDAAQGRRPPGIRSRTSSSPTASRNRARASSSSRSSCRCPAEGDADAAYKITKRRDEDISAVAGAFRLQVEDGAVVVRRRHRLRRHGGDAEARAGSRGGAGRPALDARHRRDRRWRPSGGLQPASPTGGPRPTTGCVVARNLLRRFWVESSGRERPAGEGASWLTPTGVRIDGDPRRRVHTPHRTIRAQARHRLGGIYRRHSRAGRDLHAYLGLGDDRARRDRLDRPRRRARRARRGRRADRGRHPRRERHQPDGHRRRPDLRRRRRSPSTASRSSPWSPRPATPRGGPRGWRRSSTASCRRHRRRRARAAGGRWSPPPLKLERGDVAARPRRRAASHVGIDRGRRAGPLLPRGQVALRHPRRGRRGRRSIPRRSTRAEVQHMTSPILGVPSNAVTVIVRRMGGGFGGKETQPNLFAAVAGVAARKFGRAVKLRPDRDDDMVAPASATTSSSTTTSASTTTGASSPSTRSSPRAAASPRTCRRRHRPRAVPCRQRLLLSRRPARVEAAEDQHRVEHRVPRLRRPAGHHRAERIIEEIAYALGKDPLEVRRANFYGDTDRNVTPYHQTVNDNIIDRIVDELEASTGYASAAKRSSRWNRAAESARASR